MQVYDRATKTLKEIPEVGGGAIRFTYGTAVGRILAKGILCRKFVSNAYAAWQKSPLSRGKVRKFVEKYHIDLSDCTTQDFPDFNAFFTRRRKAYEDQTTQTQLPAIADSKLTVLPIADDAVFSVKDVPYTVSELLENADLAKKFSGGWCMIFRLAPDDYHRYVYPDDATAEKTYSIAGVLHTVNPIAAKMRVYRRNARTVTLLHTAHFGAVAQLEVGALLVGKICNHRQDAAPVEKLQEKGYFAYGGSTVILLLEKDAVRPDADLLEQSGRGFETKVRIGEPIAEAGR